MRNMRAMFDLNVKIKRGFSVTAMFGIAIRFTLARLCVIRKMNTTTRNNHAPSPHPPPFDRLSYPRSHS